MCFRMAIAPRLSGMFAYSKCIIDVVCYYSAVRAEYKIIHFRQTQNRRISWKGAMVFSSHTPLLRDGPSAKSGFGTDWVSLSIWSSALHPGP